MSCIVWGVPGSYVGSCGCSDRKYELLHQAYYNITREDSHLQNLNISIMSLYHNIGISRYTNVTRIRRNNNRSCTWQNHRYARRRRQVEFPEVPTSNCTIDQRRQAVSQRPQRLEITDIKSYTTTVMLVWSEQGVNSPYYLRRQPVRPANAAF
jgi:hypothetical protein